MNRTILNRLISIISRWPFAIIALSSVLAIISIYIIAFHLTIKSDFIDLLPENLESVQELKRIENEFGGVGYIIAAIESNDLEASKEFAHSLANRLSKLPEIRYVDYKLDKSFFEKNKLLYIDLFDLNQIKDRVDRRIQLGKLNTTPLFLDFTDGEMEQQLLDFSDIESKYRGQVHFDEYYLSKDNKLLALLIKPNFLATNIRSSQQLIQRIENIINDLQPSSYHQSLKTTLTGRYVLRIDHDNSLKRDIKTASIISLIGMIAFLTLFFRRRRSVLILMPPLVVSILIAVAAAYLMFGSLNLLTSFACAILLGLGIDFGIHVYSRYLDEKKRHGDVEKSLKATFNGTWRPTLAAASTTAAAFFTLTLSDFKGFNQFGSIAGIAIIICIVMTYTLLPALIVLTERVSPIIFPPSELYKSQSSTSQWPLNSATLAVIALTLIVSLYITVSGQVGFDYNFENMIGINERQELDDKIGSIFNASLTPELIRVKDVDEGRYLAQALERKRDESIARFGSSTIDSARGLFSLVPADQHRKFEVIAEIKGLLNDKLIGNLAADERAKIDQLEASLNPEPISLATLPADVVQKFADLEGNIGRFVYVFPSIELMQGKHFFRFVEEVKSFRCPQCSDDISISGEAFIFATILDSAFDEGRWIFPIAFLCVLLILSINFRMKWRGVLFSILPSIVGILWMLGVMYLLAIKFTLMNLIVLPIIIGIGIDSSIHIYNRYLENGRNSIFYAVRHSGRAVLASTITSAIGFGSLLVAHNGGLRSIGIAAIIGLVTCIFSTVLALPTLIHVIDSRGETRSTLLSKPRGIEEEVLPT